MLGREPLRLGAGQPFGNCDVGVCSFSLSFAGTAKVMHERSDLTPCSDKESLGKTMSAVSSKFRLAVANPHRSEGTRIGGGDIQRVQSSKRMPGEPQSKPG